MKITKYLWSVSLLLVGMLGFQSCDEETYDVMGVSDNIFYFRTFDPSDTFTYNILRTPAGGKGDELVLKIPVYSATMSKSDVWVEADVDNSLVADYNSKNATNHCAFPEGVVEWVKSSVHVLSGSMVSVDSLEVRVSPDYYEKFTESTYLLPIRLVSSTDGSISSLESICYLQVNSSFKALNDGAGIEQMQGNKISEKSLWEFSLDSDPDKDFTACYDGDRKTWIGFDKDYPVITLDLGKEYNVSGIELLTFEDIPESEQWYYKMDGIQIEVSQDGIQWTDLGSTNSFAMNDNFSIFPFFGGIKAQFIRLTIDYGWAAAWGAEYMRIHEIEVYSMD